MDSFASQSASEQKARIASIDKLLKQAEAQKKNALLALREIDQLWKQRACMLLMSGKVNQGIKEIELLVTGYESSIADLHEEAAFQLGEAALASYRRNRPAAGEAFARSALEHSGGARRMSRTVLSAIELMQCQQERQSRKKQAKREKGEGGTR